MARFKSAPGSRQAMFNRHPAYTFPKPDKVSMAAGTAKAKRPLKHAELGQSRLQMTSIKKNEETDKQQVIEFPTIRLASQVTGPVISDAAAGIVVAAGIGSAVIWILSIVVLIFVVWGIVRSGQEMTAKNEDITASPWFFGVMVGMAALYFICNIVGSSLAGNMGNSIVSIQGLSAEQDQEAAVRAAQNAAGSQAAYGVASVLGLGALGMSIAALVRLKMIKKRA